MIDIPVRAKDALREGALKKNYIFNIYKYTSGYALKDTIDNTGGYSVESDADIKVRCDEAFDISITFHGVTTTSSAILDDDGTYYYDIVSPDIGSLLQVSDGTVSVYVYTDADWLLYDTIDNNTLVKESVKIDERMCSGSELKFGLCEGAALEFQYFNHDNINGMKIYAVVSVQYYDENGDEQWEVIPMGWYEVVQCPMQFSTGIRKAVAYNKLQSAYLDQKANIFLEQYFGNRTRAFFYEVRKALTDEYEIDTRSRVNFPKAPYFEIMQISTSTYSCIANNDVPFVAGSGYTPWLANYSATITLDPNKVYQLDFLHGNIDDFEDAIYQYLSDTLDASLTNGSTDRTAIMNSILSTRTAVVNQYDGCYKIFGVVLTKEDDTVEIYSKYAYDNNKYGAVGPISDIINRGLFNYKQIEIYRPLVFTLLPSSLNFGMYQSAGEFGPSISGYIDAEYYEYSLTYRLNSDIHWRSWYASQNASTFYNGLYLFDNAWWRYANVSLQENKGGYTDLKFPDGTSSGENVQSGGPYTWTTIPIAWDSFYELYGSKVENSADRIIVDLTTIADITAREATSAVYELSACYGKLDRVTDFFAPVELNNSRLLPADSLYPDNALYPNGNSMSGNPSMYSKLWTDSQGVQSFKYLIITYKTLDANNQEVEKTLQRTVNADGTTNYNCSDNWLFRNLVWTEADVGTYADAMVLKMKDVTWFPFEMWCAGLPYIETGDEVEITNSEGTFTSYVLQRQLNGIQNLQDTYINGELDIF